MLKERSLIRAALRDRRMKLANCLLVCTQRSACAVFMSMRRMLAVGR